MRLMVTVMVAAEENCKLQTPNSREAPSTRHQNHRRINRGRWILEFGISWWLGVPHFETGVRGQRRRYILKHLWQFSCIAAARQLFGDETNAAGGRIFCIFPIPENEI